MENLYNKDLVLKRLKFAELAETIKIKGLYEKKFFRLIRSRVGMHYKDLEKRTLEYEKFDDKHLFTYLESFEADNDIDNINTIKMIAVFPSVAKNIKNIENKSYDEIKYLTLIATFIKSENYDIKELFESKYIFNFINDNDFTPKMKIKLLNYFASNAIWAKKKFGDLMVESNLGSDVTNANYDNVSSEKTDYFKYLNEEELFDLQNSNKMLTIEQKCPSCNDYWDMKINNASINLREYFNYSKKELGDIEFKKDIKMIDDEIDVLQIRKNKSLTDNYKYHCARCIKKVLDVQKRGKSKVLYFQK